jgi:hypothetical protein
MHGVTCQPVAEVELCSSGFELRNALFSMCAFRSRITLSLSIEPLATLAAPEMKTKGRFRMRKVCKLLASALVVGSATMPFAAFADVTQSSSQAQVGVIQAALHQPVTTNTYKIRVGG